MRDDKRHNIDDDDTVRKQLTSNLDVDTVRGSLVVVVVVTASHHHYWTIVALLSLFGRQSAFLSCAVVVALGVGQVAATVAPCNATRPSLYVARLRLASTLQVHET